jgi:hypothetical protein
MDALKSHFGKICAVLAVAAVACGGALSPNAAPGDGPGTSSAGGDGAGPSPPDAGEWSTSDGGANGFWNTDAGGAGNGPVSNSCSGQYPAHDSLVLTNTIPSPLTAPTGMTFDGEDLWLVSSASSGATNSMETTIVRVAYPSGVVDRTFTLDLPGSDAPGAVVGGIAWDGDAIWTAVGSPSGSTLFRVDPSTGQITQTASFPSISGTLDLAFDGAYLWAVVGGTDALRLDTVNGNPLENFEVPRGVGLAIRPCEVWVGDDGNLPGSFEVFDPATGQEVSTVVAGDGASVYRGVAAFMNDSFVVVDSHGISQYEVTPQP